MFDIPIHTYCCDVLMGFCVFRSKSIFSMATRTPTTVVLPASRVKMCENGDVGWG